VPLDLQEVEEKMENLDPVVYKDNKENKVDQVYKDLLEIVVIKDQEV